MRIVACRPCSAADSATAWAWLPDDAVATPRSGASAVTALYAPRNLNAPTRWRFSALRNTCPPQRSSSVRAVSTGVRCATPRRRSAAARTSSMPIGRRSVCVAMSGRAGEEGHGAAPVGALAAVRARERAAYAAPTDRARDERALRPAEDLRAGASRVRAAREERGDPPGGRARAARPDRAQEAVGARAARGAAQMRDVARAG